MAVEGNSKGRLQAGVGTTQHWIRAQLRHPLTGLLHWDLCQLSHLYHRLHPFLSGLSSNGSKACVCTMDTIMTAAQKWSLLKSKYREGSTGGLFIQEFCVMHSSFLQKAKAKGLKFGQDSFYPARERGKIWSLCSSSKVLVSHKIQNSKQNPTPQAPP